MIPVPLVGMLLAAPAAAALLDQTITFAPLPDRVYGAPPFSVNATASSGLPVQFASRTAAICTVAGDTVTLIGAGTCTIEASQPGNKTYAAAHRVKQSFAVAKASQTIAFAALPEMSVLSTPFAPTATATSGLAVAFASTTSAVCKYGSGNVKLLAVGTCTLRASQPGNTNYYAAPAVYQSFNVVKASQTITFAEIVDRVYGASPFGVSASASSGLAVTFASESPAVCTVSGNTVTLVAAGSCAVRAAQGGNAKYAPAPPITRSFTVAKADQTIAFGALNNRTLGTAPFRVTATATSLLAVAFASSNAAVCAVNGDMVTLVAAAICTIEATQPGNANYNAAPMVARSFAIVDSGKISQAIDFAPLADRTLGTGPFALSATASSGLPVTFASLTPAICAVTTGGVALTARGTCTIRASQAGDATFAAAPNVDRSFAIDASLQVRFVYDAVGNVIAISRDAAP